MKRVKFAVAIFLVSIASLVLSACAPRVETVTVTFDLQGGTMDSPATVEVVKGTAIELPSPVKNGFAFGGWLADTESEPAVSNAVVTDDVVMTAQWVAQSEGLQFVKNDVGGYSVTGIGNCSDSVLRIPSFYQDEPVVSIEISAFARCQQLTKVVIPSSVKTIKKYAFEECENLREVVFPQGLEIIEFMSFLECGQLTSVTIPSTVEFVEQGAFSDCYRLVEVVNLSDLELTFGDYGSIFFFAKQVISSPLQSKLVRSGDYTFYNDNGEYSLVAYHGSDNCIELPSDINGNGYSINKYAFYDYKWLVSVVLPEKLTEIGEGAFENCYNLVEVINLSNLNIESESVENGYVAHNAKQVIANKSLSKITRQGEYLFYGDDSYSLVYYCGNDIDIVLPSNINGEGYSINRYSFFESELNSVVIPSNVTSIGERAFEHCSDLQSVKFEQSSQLKSIGTGAFARCLDLTNIEIPSGVIELGDTIFARCGELTVVIPSSVEKVGMYVFSNCTKATVYCEAESKPQGWSDKWADEGEVNITWGYKG